MKTEYDDVEINKNSLYISIAASVLNIGVCLLLLYRHVIS